MAEWDVVSVAPVDADTVSKQSETSLTPDEEQDYFLTWKPQNAPRDSGYDYDNRGAYKADRAGTLPARDSRGHGTDTFKKPNHPTYSTGSKIKDPGGLEPGVWSQDAQGRTVFTPGPANLAYHSPDELRDYFSRAEPDAILNMPASTSEWDVVDTTPLDPGDRVNLRMDNLDRSIGTIADSIKGPTTEPGMGNQFVAGIKAGAVGQNASMTGGALEAGSVLATGHLPTPDDFFGSIGKDLQEWGEKKTPQPRVASIADVPDFSANWKRPQTVEESDFDVNNMDGGRTFENFSLGKTLSNFGDYAAYQAGAGIGTSLPSLAVGGAAALATSNPAVGFIVSAIGPSYVQNLGDVYTSAKGDRDIQAAMKEGKVTPAQIAKTSALAAIPIAAFDSLGLWKVMGATFKPARDALVTRILKGMATGAIVEGSTEGLQDIVSQWAQTTLGQNKDWGSRVIEVVDNVLGGVFGGAAMGGAGGALPGGRPSTQPDAAPPAEPTMEDLTGEPLSTPTPDGGTVTDVAPPVLRSNLSPADQRIREIRDAVNAGRPVPPGPRGQLQEVPVEDVELAPPPAETDIAAAAQDLYDQMREPAPAANIDVQPGGDVTQVELAPPPVEQPTPIEPPASNIDVSQPFDDIENIDAAPPPQPQQALPAPSMAVDSQGNAQPQSQAEQARREFTQKERVQYDQMQKRAAKLEAKGDTEGAIAIRRKMVGLEQQTVVKPALALPAPVMAVDSQGNAQLQSERDNAAARQQAASADVERQATELERAGKPEEAIALRREAAGYTQPEGDNARAARSRAERLPPNWTDNRLARSKYRYGIRGMAEDLVKGGDITYTYDENGKIDGRTPSVNPEWFKAMNANPDTSMSTEAVKAAVEKALAGKPLGVREARVVGAMIDTFHGERGEQVDYAKQQLEAARKFRKTAAEAIGITDKDVERAGELLNEREYRADWDGPTRSLYEMADEARAVDPDTTQSILESSASDADVARQLAEVIHGRTQRNQEADPGETQAGREIEAPPAAQGAQEARARGPENGAVTPYTAADLAAREQQKRDGDKARQQSEQRAQADDQRGSFTLTGSDRTADEAAARGQQDLLDPPKSGARAQLEAKRAKSVEPSAKIEDFGEKIGGARKDDAVSTGPRTAKAKTEEDDKPGWMNRYQIGQIMRGDVDQDGRFVIRDKRLKDRMGQAKQIGRESFATREEAEKAIPLYEVARNHSVSIRSGQGEKNYAIIRKVTDRKRVTIKDGFKSNEEAMRYMAEHAVEIIETKTGFGEEILVKPEKAMRVGPERRTGPATAKMFADTFGFRAVEFGNWETQDERQEVMNHAYDGLLDLAELIGVPPKAISLNGDLALAFGARGHGLSGARAHYERDRAVINLTKMQGAGALAHELMHAIDHYFGRQDIPKRATRKQNEDGTFVFATAGREDYLSHGTAIRDSGMRKELRDAFVKMVKDMYTKAEKYVEDTEKVEQFLGKQRDQVDRTLKDMRAYMSRARDWKKRNNKAATVEQLAEWDALAEKILDGGDLTLTYKNSDKKYGSGRYTNDTVEALSAIYKTVTGSAGFTSDRSGAMDGLVRSIKYYQERIDQVESAAKSEEKTRKVPTSYAMEAKKIDQGRASDYWSTEHEMLARAFSSYVEDKLKADKKASEFLSFGSDNKFYTLLGIRPFPVGEEREAMGKAFDEFFRTVETRETDKGVGMFAARNTDAFKQWFGDSKVVDEDGQPLVVYHGTHRDFSAFDANAPSTHVPLPGFYFTPDPEIGSMFAENGAKMAEVRANRAFVPVGANVMPAFLSMQNPLEVDASIGAMKGFVGEKVIKEVLLDAQRKGHDGVVLRGWQDGSGPVQYIVFRPNQIKSATGNRGTFDPDNPDIRFAKRDHQWGEVTDTAAGPMYSNDDVTLFPAGVEGAGLWENEAVYSVVDNETGQSIGEVVVGITDGQIDTVYWIESYKKGAGTRIMRAITANSTVTIDNIMDTAKGFWDKLGIYDYDGRNAKLDYFEGKSARGVQGGVREGKGNADPARSRGNAKAGLSPEETRTYLEEKLGAKVVARLIDSGIVTISDSSDKNVPEEIRQANREGKTIFGYYDGEKTWLFSDRLNKIGRPTGIEKDGYFSEDAFAILMHEVGVHFGMYKMLGPQLFRKILDEAKAATGELGKAWAVARKIAVDAGTKAEYVDEEALAWMVTDRANHELPLIKRVIAKIRAWLLSKGFVKAMSADALVELARGAADKAGGRLDGGRFAQRARELFYSQALKAIEGAKQAKATGEQWLAELRKTGTKQEEIEWLGLDELLDGQKSVTRDELAAHVRANQVEVTEIVKGGKRHISQKHKEKVARYLIDKAEISEAEAFGIVNAAAEGSEYEISLLEENMEPGTYDEFMKPFHERPASRYESYQTPGGENYRELLLTLPTRKEKSFDQWLRENDIDPIPEAEPALRERWAAEMKGAGSAAYRSGHFDEPNILAHIRFNERTDVDGKRVLFVEEVQSDWHQAGRKHGYAKQFPQNVLDAAVRGGMTEKQARADIRHLLEEPLEKPGRPTGAQWSRLDTAVEGSGINLNEVFHNDEAVPNAPFKQSWPLLAMKRVIRWAAENGFDRVAWTTGDMQAERYDLGHHIQSVRATKTLEGHYHIFAKSLSGHPVLDDVHKESELPGVIGKELAEKIVADGGGLYSGLDLKVGGEGMKGFYDKILPNEVNKYIKKWGGKVGQKKIEGQNYAGKKIYKGPEHSIDEVRAMLKNFRTNEERELTLEMTGVITLMKTGKSFKESIESAGSPYLAKEVGGEMVVGNEVLSVHGFDLTDAMRDAAMQGQPMFARRAADDIATAVDSPAIKKRLNMKERARAVVNAIDAKITPLATMAGRTEYLTSRYLTLGRIAQTQQEARRIYDMFRKLSDADGQKVYAYLTDTEGTLEGVDATTKANATRVKKMIEQTGQALVERGVIPQESFDKYQGRYLPRVYLAYLLGDKAVAAVGAGKTLSAQSYAKSRDENLPQEYRDIVLGEIKDPAFLASRALGVPLRDLAILNWLSGIAKNPNWVLPGQTVEWTMPGMDKARTVTPYWLKSEATRLRERAQFYQGQNKTDAMRLAAEMDETADAALSEAGIALDQVPDGYKQVPNSARYGAVRGLIVVKDIYDDIVGVGRVVSSDASLAEKVLGYGGVGSKITGYWKWAKVAANPPAQIRNVVSNMVLLHLSGVPMHKLPFLIARAAKEVRTKGKFYQVGLKYGVTESTFAAQEMQRIERETTNYLARTAGKFSLANVKDYVAKFMDWTGDMYQASEMLGKVVKIMDSMEREGKSEGEAAMAAQEWLFDYSLVGQNVRYLRSAPIGAPFLTFAIKVLPRILEVAITHPARFLPYAGMLYASSLLVQSLTGADDDDLDRLKKALPEWLQENGHVMMLPVKDEHGRWQFVDVGYFFPWTYWTGLASDLGGAVKDLVTKGETDKLGKAMTGSGLLGGPIPDMLTAIKTGKDSFTGRDIIDDHMTAGEKLNAMLTYLYGMAMPPFLTGIPPFHDHATSKGAAGHIYEALTGTTDKRGEPRSTVPQALLRLVGVNVYGIEPEKARERNILFKTYEISKTVQLMKSIAKDQSLDADDRQELIDDYKIKINRMKEALDTYKKESVVAPELR